MFMRILAFSLLAFLVGCTSQPLQNVENMAIPEHSNGNQPTLAQIEQAVVSAAAKRGWIPNAVKPGLVTAKIDVRQHSAHVEIPYSRAAFSIHYKDSENLDYRRGSIHRNYNRWVANLAQDIKRELLIARSQPR